MMPDDISDAGTKRLTTPTSWAVARAQLSQADGTLNIAYAAIDRHVLAGLGTNTAMKFLAKDKASRSYSYLQLLQQTSRFASALEVHGYGIDARVYSLLGRVPELYIAALGTLRAGAVFTPLFAAFGPEPTKTRMQIGNANVVVTTSALYRKKISGWREELPSLGLVLIVDGEPSDVPDGTIHFSTFVAAGSDEFATVATSPEALALVHFTSGTTGKPKGVMHVHEAVVAHHISAGVALDLKAGDVYWCTADPGWVTGTSYGIIAPMTQGVTMIIDEAEFDPKRWYHILETEGVNVWYTAPTAIRMLMKAGTDLAREHSFDALRFMASVGEPLNPQAVLWGVEAFGQPFHDNWWQTETGSIMIANCPNSEVKPGSMGQPLPGVDAVVVTRDNGMNFVTTPNETGELAIRRGWPSMMRGYLHEMDRFHKCFVGDWYLTGDLVKRDSDGYFWFVSRADDVIQSAGHLISPFEVESVLLAHSAIAEAAVIGLPDDTIGEKVVAFVALNPGLQADETLRRELLAHARKGLGPSVAPRSIEFAVDLPRTRSGKIMRRLLKAQVLGLDVGDTSTLEANPSD